ncbi:MAG: type II and III secretion system protein family protein [Sphingopyxis sp.]
MSNSIPLRQVLRTGVMAMGLSIAAVAAMPTALYATPGQQVERDDLLLSVGRGRLINLPAPMVDVFVANQEVADVQVRSSTQLYVFGKAPGETSVYATDAAGRVVYSVVTRVGNNIETIDQMLLLAMPDAHVNVTTMNGIVLLTGTVASPEDAAEADRLVSAFVGEGTRVLSRLQTATPLQVNLQVRIAEVNRSLVREIGGNLLTRDATTGFTFNTVPRRNIGTITQAAPDSYDAAGNPSNRPPVITTLAGLAGANTIGVGGGLFGVNILAALDLAERSGMVATLAQPNLTTVSGETADFLAGGEYPIPVPDPTTGSVTIQYRKYGVSLAYTPTVLSDGRISLRVRPEVSELTTEGAITLNGISVPALSIRRAETTVELGSGESFMIAGLMSNRSQGTVDSTPGLGDLPILGNLFRSDNFRRGDTELVIVVTPYLVRPVNASDIRLPTDALQNATMGQRLLGGNADGRSGGERPMPSLEAPAAGGPVSPGVGGSPSAPQASNAASDTRNRRSSRDTAPAVAPGFSYSPN